MANDIVWDDEKPGAGIVWDDEKPKVKPKPDSVLSRIGSGLADPIYGAAQIADRAINPIRQMISPGASSMEDVIRQRDAEYKAPEGVDWARMGGNVANPLNYLGGGGGLAKTIGQSAITAAMAPTDADSGLGEFALKKAAQAGMGGAFGGAAGAVGKGVIKPTEDAKSLLRQGVRVTPGQAAKPGGIVANTEQKFTSLPFAGEAIQKARRRAVEDVQEKFIERATGTPGLRTVDDANRAVSGAYQKVVPNLKANQEGLFDAASAYNTALQNPRLTPEHQKILTGLFDQKFANYPSLDGRGLKELDSELGSLARDYMKGSPHDRVLGEELYNVMAAMRGGLEVGQTPANASLLRQANKAYRGMIPVNKAASTRADQLATPRALEKAVARQKGTDVTRMAHDPLLDPAVRTLGQTVPDSGSAGRLAAMTPLGITGGLSAYLPAAAAYSPFGTRMLLGQTAGQRAGEKIVDPAIQAMIASLRQ